MAGMRCRALSLAAGLVLVPSWAFGGIPDPRFSVIDPIGVGDNSGTAVGGSPAGFHVMVRDINNAPILGGTVTLNFSAAGVRGYSVQEAGTTINVAAQTLTRATTNGATRFAARTGRFNNSNAVEVSANSGGIAVVLGSVKWRSTDIDGLDGKTGLSDFTYFSGKYLGGISAPECNFDLSGNDVPDLADFTIMAREYLSTIASPAYAW